MSDAIHTPRLVLRNWRADDAPILYRFASHPEVGPNAGWKPHETLEESRNIIKTVLGGAHDYALVLRQTDMPVGSIRLRLYETGDDDLGPGEAEIGFWLAVPYWGRGLMPEVVNTLLAYAFLQKECTSVWCKHFVDNERSRRVQQKCGFVYHHTELPKDTPVGVRQMVANRLTREQWQQRTAAASNPR